MSHSVVYLLKDGSYMHCDQWVRRVDGRGNLCDPLEFPRCVIRDVIC